MKRKPSFPIHTADQVVEVRLVRQDHEGHQVAVRACVGGHIEAPLERGDIGAALRIEAPGMLCVVDPDVPHVALLAVGSGDVPAAPWGTSGTSPEPTASNAT